jgi:DNA-binding ferritin-like protein
MAKVDVYDLVQSFYKLSVTAHVAHVNTTSFAQHEALGNFYEKLISFKDRLVEYLMGMGYMDEVYLEEFELEDLMEELNEACSKLMMFAEASNDETLKNMFADLNEMKGKLKYFLRFK